MIQSCHACPICMPPMHAESEKSRTLLGACPCGMRPLVIHKPNQESTLICLPSSHASGDLVPCLKKGLGQLHHVSSRSHGMPGTNYRCVEPEIEKAWLSCGCSGRLMPQMRGALAQSMISSGVHERHGVNFIKRFICEADCSTCARWHTCPSQPRCSSR